MSSLSSSSSHIGRHFANATITWEIKNASLCFCPLKKIIYGPPIDISGPIKTKWRLFLDISREKEKVVLNLELLPNKFRSYVKVEWASCILDENIESSFLTGRPFTFKQNYKLIVDKFGYRSLYEKFCETAYDVNNLPIHLKIKCHMLVQFGFQPSFPKSGVEGVKSLSHDLSTLPKGCLHHDLITVVDNKKFSLHRAMLWNRGENLRTLIEKVSDMNTDFNLSNSKAAEALFTYLYTGNLSYILSTPSLAICDSIKRLGIPGMENLYPNDTIKIKSEVIIKEHYISWLVIDFENVTNTVIGPKFYKDGMNSRWQLNLKVENSKVDEEKKVVYVEAVLVESAETLDVSLEFTCMKVNNITICSRKIQGRMATGAKRGLVLLEKNWAEIKEILINNALLLRFTVRIATGEILNSNELNQASPPMSMNCEQAFMTLSRKVGLLMRSHDFSDFRFEIEDEEFKAHKFLVAARSPIFRELFLRDRPLISIRIPGCKKDIFKAFLSYMYIGIIAETDYENIMELYDMGDMYRIFSMKKVCINILKKLLNQENVLRMLVWSYQRNTELTLVAYQLVVELVDCIKKDPYYFYFTRCCPSLNDSLLPLMSTPSEIVTYSDSESD